MIDRYGREQYIWDIGAEPVQQDDYGMLWRADIPGDESLCMVELEDSTAQASGERRHYMLRVPPGVRTAREAVAWSFDVAHEEYEPAVET